MPLPGTEIGSQEVPAYIPSLIFSGALDSLSQKSREPAGSVENNLALEFDLLWKWIKASVKDP